MGRFRQRSRGGIFRSATEKRITIEKTLITVPKKFYSFKLTLARVGGRLEFPPLSLTAYLHAIQFSCSPMVGAATTNAASRH